MAPLIERVAIALGALVQLLVPWGFVATGLEIWRVAESPSRSEFFAIYLEVLVACRFLVAGMIASTLGVLLVAWGAVRKTDPARNELVARGIPRK